MPVTMRNSKKITISDLRFHLVVINKYQRAPKNPFKFPLMVLLKNGGQIFSQNINMDILLRFYCHNMKIMTSLYAKSIQNIKQLFSWFGAVKHIRQFIVEPAAFINEISVNDRFSCYENKAGSSYPQAEQMVWYKNLSFAMKNIVQSLLGPESTLICSSVSYNKSKILFKEVNKLFRNGKYKKIIKYERNITPKLRNIRLKRMITLAKTVDRPYGQKGDTLKNTFLSKINPETIVTQNNTLLKAHCIDIYQYFTDSNKSLINSRYYNYGFDLAVSTASHGKSESTGGGEVLYFVSQQKIKQEVKETKKIVIEAKEALKERTQIMQSQMERILKQHADINRLSDQVYQNIERRITFESERRGL